ncbi:MAG: PAS domain-containing protein [Methanoregula sp.]|uniref:PAS domain-containing protein n=1 Tax=Methanoregula sp. TaxID=2052170 RepID=UPI003BB1A8BE
MGPHALDREAFLRLCIVIVATISAVVGTLFSLTHGVFTVFSFLYILPIICVVYFYPRRAVLFALCISIIYIGLVYILGSFNPFLIAVSTAWFAIFVTLAVVASSYANGLLEEKMRILNIMDNTIEGILCFDPITWKIREINQKCAQWLQYSRTELKGEPLITIWTDPTAHQRFLEEIKKRNAAGVVFETLFRQKNGGIIRFIISPLYVGKDTVLCSVANVTNSRMADEEIRQTLEDLERQVRERTAHLERINDELRNEILERRRLENTLLSGDRKDHSDDEKERKS